MVLETGRSGCRQRSISGCTTASPVRAGAARPLGPPQALRQRSSITALDLCPRSLSRSPRAVELAA